MSVRAPFRQTHLVPAAPRPPHELAGTVRADVAELLGAQAAERALEAADVRLAVLRQRDTAPLALGPKLESHHETLATGAARSSASQPTSRARAASSAAAPPRRPKSRFAHRR